MEIRFAKSGDVTGILALLRQVGQLHHELRPDIVREGAVKYSASQLLEMLGSKDSPIFVAIEDKKVVGHCICLIKDYTYDSVDVAHLSLYIDDLCVDGDHRHGGIGKALYGAALEYAKRRHCYTITLNVWADNWKAVNFYEGLGLRQRTMGMEMILEDGHA